MFHFDRFVMFALQVIVPCFLRMEFVFFPEFIVFLI